MGLWFDGPMFQWAFTRFKLGPFWDGLLHMILELRLPNQCGKVYVRVAYLLFLELIFQKSTIYNYIITNLNYYNRSYFKIKLLIIAIIIEIGLINPLNNYKLTSYGYRLEIGFLIPTSVT